MNRTYSFASSGFLALTLVVSVFVPSFAEDDMPMGGQPMASPQAAAVKTQNGSMKGQKMPMGQNKSQQRSFMRGGMQTRNKMAPKGQKGQSDQMSDQELKAEFKDADKNKDGYADFNELVIHEAGDRSRAKLHFDDADRNKDRRVTEAEWIRHHKESPLHNSKIGAK